MFASPLLFDRIGWRGVANATPNFMLYAGLPFFAGCIAFTFMAGSLAPGPAGLVLAGLVMTGAIMQARPRELVCCRGTRALARCLPRRSSAR